MSHARRGFTLIEVLLVVAIIAILAGIVILAVNPLKQLGDTHNAQRRSDVNTVLNAVYQYSIDNAGILPASVSTTSLEICRTAAGCGATYADLSVLTNASKYLVAIPADPSAVNASGTGYFIVKTENNRVTVSAPSAEQGATISVTR